MTTKKAVPKSTHSKRNPLTSACPTTSATMPLLLVIYRFFIGVFVGADYPIATSLITEFTHKHHRAISMGMVSAAWYLGATVAAVKRSPSTRPALRRCSRRDTPHASFFGNPHVVPGRSHVRHLHVRSADYDRLRPGRREERDLGRERLEPVLPSGVPACYVLAEFHGKAAASHPVAVPHGRGPVGTRAAPHRTLPPAARMQKQQKRPSRDERGAPAL